MDTSLFKIEKVAYPKAMDLKLEISETPLSVWESEVYVAALVKAPENLAPGKYTSTSIP